LLKELASSFSPPLAIILLPIFYAKISTLIWLCLTEKRGVVSPLTIFWTSLKEFPFLQGSAKTPDPKDVWGFLFGYIDYYCLATKEHIEQARKEGRIAMERVNKFSQATH
jgi:hypothetical protein